MQLPISIHALHEESDGDGSPPFPTGLRFQSTLSMRRATVIVKDRALRAAISIHALHEESDGVRIHIVACLDISIHALHEESDTSRSNMTWASTSFQSTLSMRRATQWPELLHDRRIISIHALHEESDVTSSALTQIISVFQSTLSMRRATHHESTST